MSEPELKSFGKPEKIQDFPYGRMEFVEVRGANIGRAVLEHGWRWSTSVGPVAKTMTCQASHLLYHISGVLKVVMDDGRELDCRPGDVSMIPPGHDAWVVGNEPVIFVDFQGAIDHAQSH